MIEIDYNEYINKDNIEHICKDEHTKMYRITMISNKKYFVAFDSYFVDNIENLLKGDDY